MHIYKYLHISHTYACTHVNAPRKKGHAIAQVKQIRVREVMATIAAVMIICIRVSINVHVYFMHLYICDIYLNVYTCKHIHINLFVCTSIYSYTNVPIYLFYLPLHIDVYT